MADAVKTNVAEELFQKAGQILEQSIRIPVIFKMLEKRQYAPQNEEEAQYVMKTAEAIALKVLSGEIPPIPASELEQDGSLSKHAAEAVSNDLLKFAPQIETLDMSKFDPETIKAAAVLTFLELAQSKE